MFLKGSDTSAYVATPLSPLSTLISVAEMCSYRKSPEQVQMDQDPGSDAGLSLRHTSTVKAEIMGVDQARVVYIGRYRRLLMLQFLRNNNSPEPRDTWHRWVCPIANSGDVK